MGLRCRTCKKNYGHATKLRSCQICACEFCKKDRCRGCPLFETSTPLKTALVVMAILLYTLNCQAQELTSSWYSVNSLIKEGTFKYSEGVMSNGKVFCDNKHTSASWDYPLGCHLRIKNISTAKSVEVINTDRTAKRFKGKRIDLSKSAFETLAPLSQGLIKVKVEEIK